MSDIKAPEYPLTVEVRNGCGPYIAGRLSSTPGRQRPDKDMVASLQWRLRGGDSIVLLSSEEMQLLWSTTSWLVCCMYDGPKQLGVSALMQTMRDIAWAEYIAEVYQHNTHVFYSTPVQIMYNI